MRLFKRSINIQKIAENTLELIYDHKYGVMGTIAFHLFIAIILLFSQIRTINSHNESEIILNLDKEIVIEKKIIPLEKEIKKKELSNAEKEVNKLLKSIAVNEEIKSKNTKTKKLDVDKYIKDLQKNLDAKNSNIYKKKKDKSFKKDSLKYTKEEAQRKLDSIQTIFYSGPSSVSYKLKDRFKVFLPIPIFKCEKSGLVVVEIYVNRIGRVVRTRILENESKTSDDCLWNTAIDAAKRSRFNANPYSDNPQKGTITFNFVRQ